MEKNTKNKSVESRRNFIKKVAYVAPTVVALGSLVEPTNANAGKPAPGDNSKIKPKGY